MKRKYLLSYKLPMFQSLNSGGITYDLEIEVVTWWGLFKKVIKASYVIPEHHSIDNYTKHWDNLIKNKETLK